MNTEQEKFKYIVIGAGLAGISAVEGIRQTDTKSKILVINGEIFAPYHRPPLTKGLWQGKKTIDKIGIKPEILYAEQIQYLEGVRATEIDARRKIIKVDTGTEYSYERLLLASGARPRKLTIPGGDNSDVCYYRTLADYKFLKAKIREGSKVTLIGGGFIGSELAAALTAKHVQVSMVFPENHLLSKVLPQALAEALGRKFSENGIRIFANDVPVSIETKGAGFVTRTREGKSLESDSVVVGIGVEPATELATQARINVRDGIIVDQFARTSQPDIFAAGDNARFPYLSLNSEMRIEHWDHAKAHGKLAGRNMTGQMEAYSYMPYFYSDLFELGFEAVGQIDPALDVVAYWEKEFHTGVVYYLSDHVIRGVMFCNIWEQLDRAREWIQRGEKLSDLQMKVA